MFMRFKIMLWGAAIGLGLISPVSAASDNNVEGIWLTERQSEITIAPCPEGYCGYLSKIVVPPEIYKANKDAIESIGVAKLRDYNNVDPTLRERPMLGLKIVTLPVQKSDSEYEGELYNPEDGKVYAGTITVMGPDRIRLTGCAFMVFCASEEWVRAPDAQKRPCPADQPELAGPWCRDPN